MAEEFPSICFIAPNAYPLLSGNEEIPRIGGAELQMVIVARLLAAKGRRISMVCLNFGQPDEVEVDGIKVLRAFRPTGGIPIIRFFWPRLTSIWSCLKRADADIYYQQTAGMLTGVMAAYCMLHAKKSVFASASNPDLEPNTPRIRYARDRWLYNFGVRHVDRIFVQNDEQARLCRTNFSREPVLVPNCYAAPPIRSFDRESSYILWVSTIRQLKRPELFLDLAEALPHLQFRIIGGPGSGELELFESIKVRAAKIANMQFLGFVPYTRTEPQFDQATLLVNTSESEGFPNAFLQAWARGIPTISFVDAGARLDGLPVGVAVASFEEMIVKIQELTSSDAMRLEEGRRAAAYVDSYHSPEQLVKLYERLFSELVKG